METARIDNRQDEMNTNGHEVGGAIGSWKIHSFVWNRIETVAYCVKPVVDWKGRPTGEIKHRRFKVWCQFGNVQAKPAK